MGPESDFAGGFFTGAFVALLVSFLIATYANNKH